MAPPTVLSLFAGIGGIDLGLKRAGFRTACYVENDPYAVRVLQARMGGALDDAPIWDDVRTFDGKEWRDEIDLIAGGFPCQDLSIAGKREGISGGKSGLWEEMHRIICDIRPQFVLVENVLGILSAVDGQGRRGGALGRVLGDLASIRYDAEWTVLRASQFGVPQHRDRIFIIAYPSSSCTKNILYQNTVNAPSNRERMDGKSRGLSDTNNKNNRESAVSLLGDSVWPTIFDGERSRTNDGVPYKLDRYRCLGNAVVPQCAEWIGKRIIEAQR